MPMIKRPGQSGQFSQQPQQPQRALPPRGFGDGLGGDDGTVRWHDFRRHLGALEAKMTEQLEGVRSRLLSGEARIEDIVRSQPNGAMGAPGLAGIGAAGLGALGEAIVKGNVLPWFLTIDIPYDKDNVGERVVGQVLSTSDGPVFISDLMAFAFIDEKDDDAKNFPYSLIKPPSCNPSCGENAFTAADADAQFSMDFGTQLLPGLDVSGMSIPISPLDCALISSGISNLCATLECPDGSTQNFSAVVPLLTLDHPDCLSGVTEIQVNGCNWQNTQFPLDLWSPRINWDLTNEVPDCIGVGGYLDCQKILQVALTLTRPARYNTIVSFVFAGFRLITCGAGACGTPPGALVREAVEVATARTTAR